jgi:hypothetical protein
MSCFPRFEYCGNLQEFNPSHILPSTFLVIPFKCIYTSIPIHNNLALTASFKLINFVLHLFHPFSEIPTYFTSRNDLSTTLISLRTRNFSRIRFFKLLSFIFLLQNLSLLIFCTARLFTDSLSLSLTFSNAVIVIIVSSSDKTQCKLDFHFLSLSV